MDITWWRHQIKTFSALLALCTGNSPVTGESLHKSQWRGALVFSLTCASINDWVNNREAGDLRRYRIHYDVILMTVVWTKNISHSHLSTPLLRLDHDKISLTYLASGPQVSCCDTCQIWIRLRGSSGHRNQIGSIPNHGSGVIMGAMVSQITSLTIVYSTVFRRRRSKNIKAPRHCPLCGEFTGDWWIPHTNGQ